ncbi:hypothetical protein [Bradyrhizobium sp. USDA 241]|uniref:hypothetical protein n=1 Tax=Bradyrhizobium sp. USDA 241 TaxID=3377725 RepID=UPI003C784CBA
MVYDRDRKGAAQLKDYSLAEKLTKEQGSVDWMVYDRDRKGAAQLKDYSLAEKLTKEQAEQIKQRLETA